MLVLAQDAGLGAFSGNVGLVTAFFAGFVSFLSPCVFPLVPGYISVVTGLDVAEVTGGGREHLWRIARRTALFVAGFGIVFVSLGLTATAFGSALGDHQGLLTRASGVVMLAMGLFLLGSMVLEAPWLYQEARFHPDLGRFGVFAPPVAGMAFGFGWVPCIGPTLASVLAIAAADGRAGRGALLLAVYTLGLGVPFLVVGLTLGKLSSTLEVIKRNFARITAGAALVLVVFGILLTFNQLPWLTGIFQDALRSVGLDVLVELG